LPLPNDVLPGIPIVESPLFNSIIDKQELTQVERRIAHDLNERGFAVFDFPEVALDDRIERIKTYLAPHFDVDMMDKDAIKNAGKVNRVQDGWVYDEDIRAIASNAAVLDLLERLYGRRPFPFQTLNFPVGTQQPLHSDSVHFSSIPERFMCGVWLAMEDIHADAGPLSYLPGSHKWPILSNGLVGRRGFGSPRDQAQEPFEAAWKALLDASNAKPEIFLARKGQALIWAANLLHGGSVQRNPKLTRWSQVTHYYFENCIYYTPAFSDEALGHLDLRTVVNVETEELRPNCHLGEPLEEKSARPSWLTRVKGRIRKPSGLPSDFDADAYYLLNPDVAVAKLDAAAHYVSRGKTEGRRYRFK
jgi:hypothetical protein